ncbi:MAG: CYTH domain-containing protein [Oscillospiraceae bacterium]|nr:CYTH domain-containing protein [Oscillospiraceae bacterium]
MEREYKWKLTAVPVQALAAYLHEYPVRLSQDTVHMAAVYYDTPDGHVYRNGCALRIRRENDRSVCCLKRTIKKEGAQALREEYETEAATVQEGLLRLAESGAPRELCIFLSAQPMQELARTEFIRNWYLIENRDSVPFTAEFAVDVGALGISGHMEAFEELELELKSGDAGAFQAFAAELEQRFSLIPQPASKLARAIAVSGKEQTK